MGVITDKQMQATENVGDVWLTEDGPRGAGRFLGRIMRGGERAFYFRYTTSDGTRDTLSIGSYDPTGRAGLRLAEARIKAGQWSRLYQSGIKDLRSHFARAATFTDQPRCPTSRIRPTTPHNDSSSLRPLGLYRIDATPAGRWQAQWS